MATIRLKFRPSTVKGKSGSLFFQIIHRRQVKQLYTGLHIHETEWNAEEESVIDPSSAQPGRAPYLTTISESLRAIREKLEGIVSELDKRGDPYAVGDVAAAYSTPRSAVGPVSFMRRLIDDLRKIGKKSAVKRLQTTLNSLLRYTDGNEVEWRDLNSTFILGYEEFLTKCGLCRNSTSFYMRNLRAVVNRAMEQQDFEVPRNLFKHVYIGVDKTVKRAVSIDVIRKIRDVNLAGYPTLDFARKVFMFAFYTRGMAFVDIAHLKKSDLSNGVLTYSRRKTRQQLTVRIEPETMRIINSFGESKNSFLLPIITEEDSDTEQQYVNAYFRINRNLQKLGDMLGLENKLTLYVARHAWASIAHSHNVAISTISKAMGHNSEKTTVIYLQSLDTSSVDKANSEIIRLIS